MKYKNQGFTLIELLVVIALIGVLSTISLGSGKLFESSWKFELENKEIIKLIQDARVNALTAKTCGDRTKAAKKWQVVIEPQKITLQCLHDDFDPGTDKGIDSVDIKYSNFEYILKEDDPLKPLENSDKIKIAESLKNFFKKIGKWEKGLSKKQKEKKKKIQQILGE